MSIIDEIEMHCKRGSLIRFEVMGDPRVHQISESIQRKLYVSQVVHSFLESSRALVATTRAEFSNFVSGGPITVALHLDHIDCFMARLERPIEEVWELRIYDDNSKQYLRFFGRFAERDTFIALNGPMEKSWFSVRKPNYKNIKQTCTAEWMRLFKQHPPLSKGDDMYAYLSSNFNLA